MFVLVTGLLAGTADAQIFNFHVDNPHIVVTAPGTYYVTGGAYSDVWAGRTVQLWCTPLKQRPWYDPLGQGPADFDAPTLYPTIVSEFGAYLQANRDAAEDQTNTEHLEYTGNLLAIEILPTTPPGIYDRFSYRGSYNSFLQWWWAGSHDPIGAEAIRVDVQAVPEPTTAVALGLVVFTGIKTRRKVSQDATARRLPSPAVDSAMDETTGT